MVTRQARGRVVMLLENNPYPQDVRVRLEAQALTQAGYGVTVIAPRAPGQPRRELVAGVRVRRFSNLQASRPVGFITEYLVAAFRLQLAAMRELLRGANVLHLHNPPDIFFLVGAIFRLTGRKVIFDHHDLFPETLEDKVRRRTFTVVARACEWCTFRVANHVLSTNDSYAEVALTRGGKRASEVTVVRNAPPEEWLALPGAARPGALKSLRLAYVGAISSQDGVEGLAPILEQVEAHGIAASLLVIGDGDASGQLEKSMQARGLKDRVTITGWVDWDQIPQLLQDIDICVDPAPATPVNDRSTMIKVAEYLALGKPVVAFDLMETRRTAGDAALLVPPGDSSAFADAIEALARGPELREKLARLSRKQAAGLTWPHSERALLAAYAKTLRA